MSFVAGDVLSLIRSASGEHISVTPGVIPPVPRPVSEDCSRCATDCDVEALSCVVSLEGTRDWGPTRFHFAECSGLYIAARQDPCLWVCDMGGPWDSGYGAYPGAWKSALRVFCNANRFQITLSIDWAGIYYGSWSSLASFQVYPAELSCADGRLSGDGEFEQTSGYCDVPGTCRGTISIA